MTYIKWRRGSPYVYKSVREGGKIVTEYKGSYLAYYAVTGNSWRSFLGKRGQADVIIHNPERGKMLDMIDRRVKAAKKSKSGMVTLPSGTRKKLPR